MGFHIVKRDNCPLWLKCCLYLGAVALALLLGAVLLIALCDKILVLCHGKVMGVVHAHKTTKEELGLMMTGALDLTHKYEDKPAGVAKDTRFGESEKETKK